MDVPKVCAPCDKYILYLGALVCPTIVTQYHHIWGLYYHSSCILIYPDFSSHYVIPDHPLSFPHCLFLNGIYQISMWFMTTPDFMFWEKTVLTNISIFSTTAPNFVLCEKMGRAEIYMFFTTNNKFIIYEKKSRTKPLCDFCFHLCAV